MRTPVALLTASAALLVGAPATQAAVTASLSGGVLTVTGDPGPNTVEITDTGANLSIAGATVAGGSCSGTGPVTCPDASTNSITATLGDDVDVWDSDQVDKATTVDLGAGFFVPSVFQRARTGDGNDTVLGGPQAESDIVTGGGNDVIRLFGGNDGVMSNVFAGGVGSILAGPGDDTIDLGDGDDGGNGIEWIDGGPGNDTYDLGAGNDKNVNDDPSGTDPGSDVLNAGPGDDGSSQAFFLGAGNDTFDGGPGNDLVPSGGVGNDTLRGGPDNDTLSTDIEGDGDAYEGGPGDDAFSIAYFGTGVSEPASDTIAGGPGRDSVSGALSNSFAVAASFSADGVANDGYADAPRTANIGSDVEVLIGNGGADTLTGGGNVVELRGAKGADTLTAGGAPTRLDGGEGGDTLTGGGADDVLLGGAGDDALNGGGGNDALTGGAGADGLTGGDGRDTADWATATSPVSLTPGSPGDDGETGEGDTLGADVENLTGSPFNDSITGAPGPSLLSGGAGDDTITATDGAVDIVVCGTGDDGGSADAGDALELTGAEKCERISQPAATPPPAVPAPAPAPVAPPTLVLDPLPTLAAVGKVDSKGRAQVRVSCPTAAAAACTGDVRLVDKKGEPRSRKVAFRAAPGRSATVRITLGTADRRTLRRTKKVATRLLAEVAGPSGTFRRVTRAVTLRR